MLVLSRKKNESIMIGKDIEIVVSEIEDGKVKLGIKAPKDIEIHRKEIFEEIQEENRAAMSKKNVDLKSVKKVFNK
ncbi:MAG: carbon storage regulator CsrA [Tissierellales bacterium]|jgi:carbon storage regulator|nr:carbon storage regulator CsrA [Tissierellales bacterium]